MLRCSALVRAALRAPKQDVAQVTRTLSQLSIPPQSSSWSPSEGPVPSLARTFATKTATRTRKPAARKTAGAPKKGKATTTKKTTKKTTTRAKAKPKAKPKPKPRKRVLTEKGKAALEKKKAAASLRELKATALTEPKGKPETAWVVFTTGKLTGSRTAGSSLSETVKSAAADFKNLSVEEREQLNHQANQNKAANQAAYKKWVESYTPDRIRLANIARKSLQRKVPSPTGKKSSRRGVKQIHDERQVKRPQSAYFKFTLDRKASGDFKGIALGDVAKQVTKEWNELSAGEKKKYEDLHQADKERYLREHERVYGHAAPAAKATKA